MTIMIFLGWCGFGLAGTGSNERWGVALSIGFIRLVFFTHDTFQILLTHGRFWEAGKLMDSWLDEQEVRVMRGAPTLFGDVRYAKFLAFREVRDHLRAAGLKTKGEKSNEATVLGHRNNRA
jgi:hypothetical protein